MSQLDAGAGPDRGPASAVPAPPPARLWLVRHGETEWSRAHRHTGRTDLPLTPHGEEQARALADLLRRIGPAHVVSSPLRRARHTAELAGLGEYTVDDRLAEWDYGEYEGLTSAQIREHRPGWTIWSGDPPGGETAEQVRARVDGVLDRLRAALADGPVVAVTHGHLGRALTARWLGLPVRDGRHFLLGPAAPGALGAEHGSPAIARWNLPNPADSGLG